MVRRSPDQEHRLRFHSSVTRISPSLPDGVALLEVLGRRRHEDHEEQPAIAQGVVRKNVVDQHSRVPVSVFQQQQGFLHGRRHVRRIFHSRRTELRSCAVPECLPISVSVMFYFEFLLQDQALQPDNAFHFNGYERKNGQDGHDQHEPRYCFSWHDAQRIVGVDSGVSPHDLWLYMRS
ncbi:hypothetical protein CDAR_86851 [Caerostris darwini]|uniref:Uncharacterized protein n=1 Tax=Caerostris darwini TaxID=1538125 RepID=A0AAV4VNK0_9ARAC|nr:hypothetical protein CDAR_86851 [Caerostris darwini]